MPTFKPQYKDKNGIIQDLNIDYNSLANKPTTKNEIESLKSNINTLDKRVTSIESRLSDRIFKVDSDIAYTKTVPAGALPYASIDCLGGITKKYNQLVDKSKFPATKTVNGVTYTNNGDGSVTANGTATGETYYIFHRVNLITNHKYLLKGCPSGGSKTTYFLQDNINYIYDTGNGQIYTPSIESTFITIYVYNKATVSNVVLKPQLIDLTAMYGAGNEPTTVEQFLADNPMYNDYVEYTEGDIINTNVTSIDSIGVNIWDEEWEVGSFDSEGQPIQQSTIRSKNFIKIISNTTYYFHSGNNWIVIYFYDSEKNLISSVERKNSAAITPENAMYMKFRMDTSYGTTYNHNICINVSNDAINGTYIPYFSYNYPIPSSIQSLEGYGWGVNDSCYNYVDFEGKKFVKRVGRVDLGTLNWDYSDGGVTRFVSRALNNVKPLTINIICSKFISGTNSQVYTGDAQIAIHNDGTVWVLGTVIEGTSPTAFKTAMSGVYLYYELATPVITDISNILTDDNFIEVEANGTLTFENTNKKAVPSKIAYLVEVK